MSRLHDMGGRLGDGPVQPDPERAPVFDKPWHARALALTLAAGGLGQWPLDRMRHQRECLSPQDYMRFSYYEKWLSGLADILVGTGVVSVEELKAGCALSSSPALKPRKLKPDQLQKVLSSGGPSLRETDAPSRFAAGDRVNVRQRAENALVPQGHSRLPAYIQGAEGRVLCDHGAHVLPDSNAHGLGEAPEPLYSVVFRHGDVWAASAHPHDELVLDMWQSYLEEA